MVIDMLLVDDAMRYAAEMRAIEKQEMKDAIIASSFSDMTESGRRRIMQGLKESKGGPPAKKISGDMAKIGKSIQDELDRKKREKES